jgi:tetraacyldisaccharide 4'-kinase
VRRYWAATPYRSRLPVVCVGNFTAGGTGKTPLVLHLCERLKAAGHEPVALTRGYRGRLAGPYWVSARSDVARDVGDEALLLARAAPTLLARDRRAGAVAIESGPHPVTVIVMDDGLQNPALAKDLTLAVVDGSAGRGLGNGLVMPAGPLRAPLGFQLELTDAVVVCGPGPDGESEVAEGLRHRFAGPVLSAGVAPAGDAAWLAGAAVVAWAGIGAPQRFFATLERLGARILDTVAFRDHAWLTEADAARLLDLARRHTAMLVTTEKDMARLTGAGGACADLAAASRVLPVRVVLAASEAERLMSLVDAALRSRR